jgi:NADH:ubiquinone oxidoreductase subunit 3 (subunit A)
MSEKNQTNRGKQDAVYTCGRKSVANVREKMVIVLYFNLILFIIYYINFYFL